MSDVQKLLRTAEEMCSDIAKREMDGQPCYAFTLEEHLQMPGSDSAGERRELFGGFTQVDLDLYARNWLTEQGRWRGRGFATCVNVTKVVAACNLILTTDGDRFERSGMSYDELLSIAVNSVAIHEFAHYFVNVGPLHTANPKNEIELLEDVPFFDAPPESPWERHGLPFLRFAIHLVDRAERRGWDASLSVAVSTSNYQLSSIEAYRDALADEPREWKRQHLLGLGLTDPPAAFADLFASDVAAYRASLTEPAPDAVHHLETSHHQLAASAQ